VKARVANVGGPFGEASGDALTAYEIHAGVTRVGVVQRPFVVVERQGRALAEPDGALSAQGNVVGTYLHGLFANDTLRQAFLVRLASRNGETPDPRWGQTLSAGARYDRLADLVGSALDMPGIGKLVGLDYLRGNGRSA
jgi:adenosylcobyric acid synthase